MIYVFSQVLSDIRFNGTKDKIKDVRLYFFNIIHFCSSFKELKTFYIKKEMRAIFYRFRRCFVHTTGKIHRNEIEQKT